MKLVLVKVRKIRTNFQVHKITIRTTWKFLSNSYYLILLFKINARDKQWRYITKSKEHGANTLILLESRKSIGPGMYLHEIHGI
jgi:hypothetical protein